VINVVGRGLIVYRSVDGGVDAHVGGTCVDKDEL
jgi:hypothetical protein